MITILLSFRIRSRASLELELVALRHQVVVLRRQYASVRGHGPTQQRNSGIETPIAQPYTLGPAAAFWPH